MHLADPEAGGDLGLGEALERKILGDNALAFYGERLGLKIFRKHLGWYVERAPWPVDAGADLGADVPGTAR